MVVANMSPEEREQFNWDLDNEPEPEPEPEAATEPETPKVTDRQAEIQRMLRLAKSM